MYGDFLKLFDLLTLAEKAEFWDTHDITEFEDELIEVEKPGFRSIARFDAECHSRRI